MKICNSKYFLLLNLFLLLILIGCAEPIVKVEWHPKKYVTMDLPSEWNELLQEEQITNITFKYFKDLAEFYLPVINFTTEMENSINDIDKILSDKNMKIFFEMLQIVPEMYANFESFNIDSTYPFFSNFSNKEINARYMLTFKLYVLVIYYSKNVEILNKINNWFAKNFNRLPAEFQVANYLQKYQETCQQKYSLQLEFLKLDYSQMINKLNYDFEELPTNIKDIENLCWTPFGDIFQVERHNFYHNYLITYYLREVLKIAQTNYYKKNERNQFVNRYQSKSKLFNALQARILYQRLRFEFARIKNKDDLKTPEYPAIRFVNLLYKNIEKELNTDELIKYFNAWEDFCYKHIDKRYK